MKKNTKKKQKGVKKTFDIEEYFSKSLKDIRPSSNWEDIISVIKNEKRYVNNLIYEIEDILEKNELYNSGSILPIEINLGTDQKEPDLEYLSAIQYIKTDFLKFLEHYKVIKNLKIEQREEWWEDGDGPYFYISADFIVNSQNLFRIRALELAKIYAYRTKEKIDKKDKITLDSQFLCWRDKKIPFLRNRYPIIEALFESAEIYKGDKQQKKGKPINLQEFVKPPYYKTYNSAKDALKEIKKDLKGFPISIDPRGTKHFLMTIRNI